MYSHKYVTCSVCVSTYKRPVLLKLLLISLINQVLPKKMTIEIIIVDSDTQKSAYPIIQEIREKTKIEINYYSLIINNISISRNHAIYHSKGDLLAFIDDDETAPSYWVYNLIDCLNTYNSDGVFGPVIPLFNHNTPAYIAHRNLYYSGIKKTGEICVNFWTSNALIKSEIIRGIHPKFDVKYGYTGGEDMHLFARLKSNGAYFINCTEAVVYEHIPTSRSNERYILKRSLKGGNSFTRRQLEFTQYPENFVLRIYYFVKSSLGLAVSGVAIMTQPNHKKIKWKIKAVSNVGHLMATAGYHHKAYINPNNKFW